MTGLQKMTFAPLLLMVVSVIMGCNNYEKAKTDMQHDLNQALRMMVMDAGQREALMDSVAALQGDAVLTLGQAQDMLCRQLTIASLKDTSHVSLCLVRNGQHEPFCERAVLRSDTLLCVPSHAGIGDLTIAIKAFANPSWWSVMRHSRQRLPLTGIMMGLLGLMALAFRKNMGAVPAVVEPDRLALPAMRLTPMQEQLIHLFASAPGHVLSKETICSELWPKKDRPEDTLYTFISRLKTSLHQQSDLDIVNKRGKEYQLVSKTQNADNL